MKTIVDIGDRRIPHRICSDGINICPFLVVGKTDYIFYCELFATERNLESIETINGFHTALRHPKCIQGSKELEKNKL